MPAEKLNADALYAAALEVPAGPERAAFLYETCAGDDALRQRVAELLEAGDRAGSFLEAPAPELGVTIDQPAAAEKPGTKIGPYKLREQIGEGGFGVVYVAEQEQPVARKVALKIIKPGMDTKDVIARFEAERQALALMDHPNVARVLDAGATESGRPYFVMELVRGVPVTRFCDEQKLPTRERLRLFLDVCRAVQHAHQRGIIHRDLKPSNVMVTLHDDKPVVKVIDFGVAKALSRKLTEKTLYTAYNQMVGTPLYMSPEQAQMSGLDVDTRSDVYSLGVLLYELLTGTTPFDRETMKQADFDELRRIIREDVPPRPSARISTMRAEALTTVSDSRRIDPRKLGHALRGELDWIVMKALEKDRNRRYESASAFAADLERLLNQEPVEAHPPSLAYRFRKFLRRRKGTIGTTTVVALSLLIGTGLSSWQAVRATDEARRAHHAEGLAAERLKQVDQQREIAEKNYKQADAQRKLSEAILQVALDALEKIHQPLTEWASPGNPPPTDRELQLLESTLPFYERLAALETNDPQMQLARARAYHRVFYIHRSLFMYFPGHEKKAEQALRRAIVLFKQISEASPDNVNYRHQLAQAYHQLAQVVKPLNPDESELAYRKSISIYKKIVDDSPPSARHELATVQRRLGYRLLNWGKTTDAEQPVRESLANFKKLAAAFPEIPTYQSGVVRGLYGIGLFYRAAGRTNDAIAILRKAGRHAEGLMTRYPNNPSYRVSRGTYLTALSQALLDSHRPKEAEQAALEAVKIVETGISRWPKDLSLHRILGHNTYRHLASLYSLTDRPAKSANALRRSLELKGIIAAATPNDKGVLQSIPVVRSQLAQVLKKIRDRQEALAIVDRVAVKTADQYLYRAGLYKAMQQDDQAHDDYRQALEWIKRNNPKSDELKRDRAQVARLLGIPAVARKPRPRAARSSNHKQKTSR